MEPQQAAAGLRSICDRGFGPSGAWRGYQEVVDHHAARSPNAPAVEDAQGQWSYAQLQAASHRAAAFFAANGLGAASAAAVAAAAGQVPRWEAKPEAPRPLAMYVPRSREFVALCLGAWRLGLPVVALSTDMADKKAERDRSEQALRDLRPLAILADEGGDGGGSAAALPLNVQRLPLGRALEAVRGGGAALPATWLSAGAEAVGRVAASPERVLAYVYTGGTTKASKCVTVTHGMALWEAENYGIVLGRGAGPGDKMLQYSSLYWGAAVFGQLSIGLAVGACVCIGGCPAGCGGAGDALRQLVVDTETFGITVLGVVPSQLRGAWPDGPATAPGALRMLVVWADKCPVELSRRWKTNRIRVVDLLIASEYWLALHSDCSVWTDGTVEKHVYKKLPSLEARFLVEVDNACGALRDAAVGEVGEMYLAGPTTSPGYVCPDGRVGLDFHGAMRVIDGRAYLRTRDQLLLLPDGGLVYAGRADSMMKHGGQWVDADALQDAVTAVPGVAQAAVLPGAQGIDAFVVLSGSSSLDVAAAGPGSSSSSAAAEGATPEKRMRVGEVTRAPFRVLASVRKALPSSTPGGCRIHLLTGLPLNPATAKVDRKALAAYLASFQEELQRHGEAQDRTEERLVRYYTAWGYLAVGLAIGPQLVASLAADLSRAATVATWAAFTEPAAAAAAGGGWLGCLAGTVAAGCCLCVARLAALPQLWVASVYLEDRLKDKSWTESLSSALRRRRLPAQWSRWFPIIAAALLPAPALATAAAAALAFVALVREGPGAGRGQPLSLTCSAAVAVAAAAAAPWTSVGRSVAGAAAEAVGLQQGAGLVPGLCAVAGATLLLPPVRSAAREVVRVAASAPALCYQVVPKYLAEDFGDLLERHVLPAGGTAQEGVGGGCSSAAAAGRCGGGGGGGFGLLRRWAADLRQPRWTGRMNSWDKEAAVVDPGNAWDQVYLTGDRGQNAWNSVGIVVYLQDSLASADSPLAAMLHQAAGGGRADEATGVTPGAVATASPGGANGAAAIRAEGLAGALAALVERVCGGQGTDALHGLDSMQAIQLSEAVRREFHRPLTVSDVLKCGDLEQLLEVVQAASAQDAAAAGRGGRGATGQREARDEASPWRVWLCGLGPRMCTVDWMVSRQDRALHLDVPAMQRAVDRLVARHAALRARNSSELPLFMPTYDAASLWQLWCAGGRRDWTRAALGWVARSSIYGAWPRTNVLHAGAPEARTPLLVPSVADLLECEGAQSSDQQAFWVGGTLLGKRPGEMFHVCVVPIFSQADAASVGAAPEASAAEVALALAPERVQWYLYAVLDHGYCDGPTGAPLFADLLRLYGEESGEEAAGGARALPPQERCPAEALAVLERRLQRSLMPLPEAEHANEDIFHDGLVGFGWRRGYQRFIRFDTHLMRLLRVAARDALGCSVDVAWLTAIAAAFLRLFPALRRLDLYLIVTCRDGPGEEAMIGYFASRKLMPIEVGDSRQLALLGLADKVSMARRQRSWKRPRPMEKASAIEINIVSQAADGLPLGFQEVRCPRSAPRTWDRGGTSNMQLRLDQVARDDWDFRMHSHDAAWGENWSNYYAQALGSVIVDMALRPTGPVVPRGAADEGHRMDTS